MVCVEGQEQEVLQCQGHISPIDTLQLATQEVETWRVAQLLKTLVEEEHQQRTTMTQAQSGPERRLLCQVDGSWSDKDDWMGIGFVLLEDNTVIVQDHKCCPRAKSPIHVEAEGIVWAMKEARDRGYDGINFASDCQQLINLITRNEEWPALALELNDIKLLISLFRDVSFSFLPDNFRADSLAKGGRSRAQSFAVVDVTVLPSPALEAGQVESE